MIRIFILLIEQKNVTSIFNIKAYYIKNKHLFIYLFYLSLIVLVFYFFLLLILFNDNRFNTSICILSILS